MTPLRDRVFVFVLEDRHCDDTIRVHATEEGAMRSVVEWQSRYGDRYEWKAETIAGLTYYATGGDDAPKMRIEPKDVWP